MTVKIGNYLFHIRNGLFPLFYLLLFLPSPSLCGNYELALLVGIGVSAMGQLCRVGTIGLDYIIRGGRKRRVYAERLVQGGIFAHCRNPLYVGNILMIIGVGIASNSLIYCCIAIPFFLFAYWCIVAAEENFLRNKFGTEFNQYCQKVNRFLPSFTGLGATLRNHAFDWQRVVVKEYNSTYVWCMALTLVSWKNIWLYPHAYVFIPNSVWFFLSLILLFTLLYCLARFLKKSGRLRAQSQ